MNRFHSYLLPSSAFHPSFLLLTVHISLLTFLFTLPAFSQQTWQRTYGGPGTDYSQSVQQTSDGGYIVAGGTNSFGNGDQVYLIKTNGLGDTLWTRTYGGTGDDYSYSVQQTLDGGYIVAGIYDALGANAQVYLIKTNPSGDTLWTRTYGGTNIEWGLSVQQTTDGGYIVAGLTTSFGNQGYLIKTDASGDTLWTKTYGGSGDEDCYSVQQTPDGGYIVAGATSSFGGVQVYLIKTDASGDTLWTRNYGGGESRGRSVQQTQDGGYIIAGFTSAFGNYYQVYLIKTDASGDTLWTRNYGGASEEEGYSVRQTQDGGYIVAGTTSSFGNDYQVYLIKTNAGGDTLWTRNYGGADGEEGFSVRQTQDGGYIVAGNTTSFGNGCQVYLIKTDSLGNSTGVEENAGVRDQGLGVRITAKPNPFTSFVTLPGHEAERFSLYDISGRKVGTYKGDRIGEGLGAGVYFLRLADRPSKPLRVVKVQ